MSKPENALEFNTEPDLSRLSAEDAVTRLEEELRKLQPGTDFLKVVFEAKISFRSITFARDALSGLRIPFHVVDYYDWDEWSIVGTAIFVDPPHVIRSEIWSPGA